MAVDLSVFDRVKTKMDYDREEALFNLKKKAAMGSDPAAIQLADEIGKARASGDTQRLNDLYVAAKSWDKGVVTDPNGNPVAMGGYGDAVGSIEGAKAGYKQNAQNQSDLYYKPQIERDVETQKSNVELGYAEPIATAKKTGEIQAQQVGDLNKKADSANSMGGLTQQARTILQTGKPTGSYAGAGVAFGKRIFGISDESTQANADLDVIAGNLTGNIPRMEGPQSDADRIYYQQQAGRVGDRTLPIEDRLASLDAIDRINAKYAGVQTPTQDILSQIPRISVEDLDRDPMAASRNAVMERNAQGIQNPYQTLPQPQGQPAAPKKGQVVNGYIFMGGDPSKQSNWKKK